MAKAMRMPKPSQAEFVKLFSDLCYARSSWTVWIDFVTMMATTISNACDTSDLAKEREKQFLEIEKTYSKKEMDVMAKLFAAAIEALEKDPEQDFFGEIFMALDLGSHWKGQFFTPYHVCEAMARMSLEDAKASVERKGYISILDPACGAGALLVAARNDLQRKEIGFDRVLYVAQDLDRNAALMCYIQLSLLGCVGYVVIGDTLANPAVFAGSPVLPVLQEGQDIWYTPMFYTDVWHGRRVAAQLDLLIRRTGPAPDTVAAEPKSPPAPETNDCIVLSEGKSGQLVLF